MKLIIFLILTGIITDLRGTIWKSPLVEGVNDELTIFCDNSWKYYDSEAECFINGTLRIKSDTLELVKKGVEQYNYDKEVFEIVPESGTLLYLIKDSVLVMLNSYNINTQDFKLNYSSKIKCE
jgi:hypothetical protein